MRKILLSTFLSLVILALFGQNVCDTTYWNHTYANARLKIYNQGCMSITGTIKTLLPPALTGDGDYHIYVLPDTQYSWMVSYRDSAYLPLCEGSDSDGYRLICIPCLNVEEVCKGAPTDASVSSIVDSACENFNDTTYLPNVGEYVRATGPFIYDTVHCWNELHPISSMIVLGATNIPEPNGASFLDGMKIFPQPANDDMEFAFAHPPHALTFIKLYNAQGRQLYVYGMAETNVLYLDVSTWPSGTYLYTIVSQEQGTVLKSGKISVVH